MQEPHVAKNDTDPPVCDKLLLEAAAVVVPRICRLLEDVPLPPKPVAATLAVKYTLVLLLTDALVKKAPVWKYGLGVFASRSVLVPLLECKTTTGCIVGALDG